jgi:putative hydrolase of the HAD superfamily
MKIQAIIFDIGDTILSTKEIIRLSLEKALSRLEIEGLINDKLKWSRKYEQISKSLSHLHINHLFSDRKIISSVVKLITKKDDLIICGAFLTYFRENVRKELDKYQLDISIFSFLKNKGYQLNIISDGTTLEALEILTRLGIIKYFNRIIVSEDIGIEKPSPIIFREFLKEDTFEPSNYLMIGDNEIRDIQGAKKLGFTTVLINKKTDITSEADFILSNISQLQKIL